MLKLSRFMGPALLAAATLLALPAQALTLAPADQGTVHLTRSFFSISYSHAPSDTAMTLMSFGLFSGGATDRAYALFDIPAGLPAVGSATLHLLVTPPSGFPDISYSFNLFDVGTAAAAFQASFSGPATADTTALFDDLANGAAYGSGALPGTPQMLSITLTPEARADLALASGGMFGIGFSGFGLAGSPLVLSDLTLEVTAVPEPATVLLWALGVGGLAMRRRRSS